MKENNTVKVTHYNPDTNIEPFYSSEIQILSKLLLVQSTPYHREKQDTKLTNKSLTNEFYSVFKYICPPLPSHQNLQLYALLLFITTPNCSISLEEIVDTKKNIIDTLNRLIDPGNKFTLFEDIANDFLAEGVVQIESIVKNRTTEEVKIDSNITRTEHITEVDKIIPYSLINLCILINHPINQEILLFKDTAPDKYHHQHMDNMDNVVYEYPGNTFKLNNPVLRDNIYLFFYSFMYGAV